MIYKFFPKFHVRHEGFSFFGPDEGADTDLYIISADFMENYKGTKKALLPSLVFSFPCQVTSQL